MLRRFTLLPAIFLVACSSCGPGGKKVQDSIPSSSPSPGTVSRQWLDAHGDSVIAMYRALVDITIGQPRPIRKLPAGTVPPSLDGASRNTAIFYHFENSPRYSGSHDFVFEQARDYMRAPKTFLPDQNDTTSLSNFLQLKYVGVIYTEEYKDPSGGMIGDFIPGKFKGTFCLFSIPTREMLLKQPIDVSSSDSVAYVYSIQRNGKIKQDVQEQLDYDLKNKIEKVYEEAVREKYE